MAEKDISNLKHSYEQPGAPLSLETFIGKTTTGELGRTGIVVFSGENIDSAIRSPHHIPSTLFEDGLVAYGGKQCEGHVELNIVHRTDDEIAQIAAQEVLDTLKNGTLEEVYDRYKAFGVGLEPERWIIDGSTGKLAEISGGELQLGLLEDQMDPEPNPVKRSQTKADLVLSTKSQLGEEVIVAETSVPYTDRLSELRVNRGGEKGHYVQAIQNWFFLNTFHAHDPYTRQLFNEIAVEEGFEDWEEMRESIGNITPWAVAASHCNIGLGHIENGNGHYTIPAQVAVAASDLLVSDMGVMVENMTLSSSMIAGKKPFVDGVVPRDYRLIARHLMDTTLPIESLMHTPEEMDRRAVMHVVNGTTHTLDRASYDAMTPDGQWVASMHGRVRNRRINGDRRERTGRVEYTGGGSTPDIRAEIARDCLAQVLVAVAYESVAEDMHPSAYVYNHFGFTSAGSLEQQSTLSHNYNTNETLTPDVQKAIDELMIVSQHIQHEYPDTLGTIAAIAQAGLRRMINGNTFSDHMRRLGITDPLTAAREAEQFQLDQANKLINATPDEALALLLEE